MDERIHQKEKEQKQQEHDKYTHVFAIVFLYRCIRSIRLADSHPECLLAVSVCESDKHVMSKRFNLLTQ